MDHAFFNVLGIIIPILAIVIFIFVLFMMFSSKLRGRWMGKQVKATRYMLDQVKDDLTDMGVIAGDIEARTKKRILDQHEESLKEVSIRQANIDKHGIKIRAQAIQEGFQQKRIYCKYCGEMIDEDSKFCKYCGKDQL